MMVILKIPEQHLVFQDLDPFGNCKFSFKILVRIRLLFFFFFSWLTLANYKYALVKTNMRNVLGSTGPVRYRQLQVSCWVTGVTWRILLVKTYLSIRKFMKQVFWKLWSAICKLNTNTVLAWASIHHSWTLNYLSQCLGCSLFIYLYKMKQLRRN